MWLDYVYRIKLGTTLYKGGGVGGYQINTVPTPAVAWTRVYKGGGGDLIIQGRRGGGCLGIAGKSMKTVRIFF